MRKRRLVALFVASIVALSTAGPAWCGDFNGDGFDDLAVGIAREPVGGTPWVGAVQIFPGSNAGPDAAASFILDLATLGLPPQTNATFAYSLAWGNFDGDAFDDLAIGAPTMAVAGLAQAGRVYIVPGGASGFDIARAKSFDQNTKNVKDKVQPIAKGSTLSHEFFGGALQAADFDADGFDDLAITVLNESVGKTKDAGAIHVLYGSAIGLRAKRNQFWHKNSKSVKGKCATSDHFGFALASGDLNGDGFADLVMAVQNQHDGTPGVGRVAVLFGSKKGLRAKKNVLFKPDAPGLPLTVDLDDAAIALACGNFDGDAFDDLAIGVGGEPFGSNGNKSGAVWVARGSATGLLTTSMTGFFQGDGIVPGASSDFDQFGTALAAADFNADGKDDLAIGAPGETVSGEGSGRVTLLYGSANGLAAFGAFAFDQDTSGIFGNAEMGDAFALALAAQDFDGNGVPDLAIGAPGEDVTSIESAGAVNVLFSFSGFGVTTANNLLLHQDQPSTPGFAEVSELFGYAFGN